MHRFLRHSPYLAGVFTLHSKHQGSVSAARASIADGEWPGFFKSAIPSTTTTALAAQIVLSPALYTLQTTLCIGRPYPLQLPAPDQGLF